MPLGTAIVDFGAAPGSLYTTVAVTGQGQILAGSLVEAWIRPIATADHRADEHIVDPPEVVAADIVLGTGFTIHARSNNSFLHHGQYTVAWAWT